MPKLKENLLPKHHYIPVFYLKQWIGGDRKLCEFSRKWKLVKPRRTSPDGTGYVRGLYRLPNVPEDKAEIVETGYMQIVDNHAARALQVLIDPNSGPAKLPIRLRVAWARFLHCLILRSPEYLAAFGTLLKNHAEGPLEEYRSEYERLRTERDPPSFDEFLVKFRANPLNTSSSRIIHRIIDSDKVIGHISSMSWNIVQFANSPNLLLTSDRPVIMTNGLNKPESHIGMPISPTQLFIAFNDAAGFKKVSNMPPKELIRTTNMLVAEQAREYVYGFSDASLSFVSSRLGARRIASPLENGMLRLAMK